MKDLNKIMDEIRAIHSVLERPDFIKMLIEEFDTEFMEYYLGGFVDIDTCYQDGYAEGYDEGYDEGYRYSGKWVK